MRIFLLLLMIGLLAGCTSTRNTMADGYVTTYYDRNHDGIVDFELHSLPGGCDTDWALSDTRFCGRYDLKIVWGYAHEKKRVDIPVPAGVPITSEFPELPNLQ
jgi:uncharacterized protein YceK